MNDDKLELRPSAHGDGVFARKAIAAGDIIVEFRGPLFRQAEIPAAVLARRHCMLVDEGFYLGPSGGFDDYINHSCEPNALLRFRNEQIFCEAWRDIKVGEEICFDYSTVMGDGEDTNLPCLCGSKRCRGIICDFIDLPLALQEQYLELGAVSPANRKAVAKVLVKAAQGR